MIDAVAGTTCPACEGRLVAGEGTQYVCERCGEGYDVAEMFMP